MDLQLRPYQQRLIDVSAEHLTNFPTSRPVIVAPTASGKSVIVAALCAKLAKECSGMILVLTHRRELVAQNAAKLPAHMNVGVYSAGLGRKELHRITIAGFQSIRKQANKLPNVSYIIIDECHYATQGYRDFIDAVAERSPKLRVIGLTATPFDGTANRTALHLLPKNKAIFTGIGAEVSMGELLRDKYLTPLIPYSPTNKLDTSGVGIDNRLGDFAIGQLQVAVDVDESNVRVAGEIMNIFASRQAVMVFCTGVDHTHHMVEALRALGEDADCVLGDTPEGERDKIIARFKAGRLKYLVACEVLLVGFDAPICDGIANLRPTKSGLIWVQLCLDSETEILTSHGWKGPNEMRVGDCAMTLDEVTGGGVWSPVEEVIQRQMHPDEKWVEYSAPRANFRVTDQHRMIYDAETNSRGFERRTGPAIEMASLKNGVRMPTAVRVDQAGVPLTDDELYFIGMMMTDGTWGQTRAEISQSERHPEIIAKIEQTLNNMGVPWTKKAIEPPPDSAPIRQRHRRWVYRMPMNFTNDQHSGVGYLLPYLSKDLAPALFAMSKHQFETLVSGLFDGDGFKVSKCPSTDWVPRSLTICSARKLAIDRLQALAAMNGYTANARSEKNGSIHFITLTDKDWRSVGGSGARPQIEVLPATDEMVWCVRTGTGTIVTRRRGKVTVMGNCGRGMRLHPDKEDCLVADFTDTSMEIGPINEIEGNPPRLKTGEAVTKICPECFSICLAGLKLCPTCGFEFEFQEHDNAQQFDPITGLIISQVTRNPDGTRTYPVERVEYEIRRTVAGDPALVASYLSPGRASPVASEYLNLWHHKASVVARDAATWLRRQKHAGGSVPVSAQEALARAEMGALKTPRSVTVRPGSLWPIRFSV